MRKILKYISVFFLLFAGLAFSAHQIIPHDHHLADTDSNQNKNCPASNDKSNHQSGFPIHCHAFNDIASVEPITYVLIKYIQSENLSTSCPDTYAINLPVSGITIANNPDPVLVIYLPGLSPFRAPPSLI